MGIAKQQPLRADDFPVESKYGWKEILEGSTYHYKVENPEKFKPGCSGYITRGKKNEFDEYEVDVRINE